MIAGKIILPIAVQTRYKPDYWLEEIFPRNRVPELKLATIRRDIVHLERDIMQYAKIKPVQSVADASASIACHIL